MSATRVCHVRARHCDGLCPALDAIPSLRIQDRRFLHIIYISYLHYICSSWLTSAFSKEARRRHFTHWCHQTKTRLLAVRPLCCGYGFI